MPVRINPNYRQGGFHFTLTADILKIIALLLTVQATVGVSIISRGILHLDTLTSQEAALSILEEGDGMAAAYSLFCRFGGTIAWLVFALMAVTGFQYTSSPRRYLIRVAVTALISEIPYDLCVYGSWFSLEGQNVLFSILVGLLVLVLAEDIAKSVGGRILFILGGILWTVLLKLQCGYLVVSAMLLFYYLEERELVRDVLILALCALDVLFLGSIELALIVTLAPAALALLMLHWYSDDMPRLPKWIFYAAYPLHLIVIAILCNT